MRSPSQILICSYLLRFSRIVIISNILSYYPDKYADTHQIMWPNFLIKNYCSSTFNLLLMWFKHIKELNAVLSQTLYTSREKSIAYIFSAVKVTFRQNNHLAVLAMAFKELQLQFWKYRSILKSPATVCLTFSNS